MKKVLYLAIALIAICSLVVTPSCGPSAAEQARLDSIRLADSLYRIDSIRMADSIATVRKLEASSAAMSQKVLDYAASVKSQAAEGLVVPLPELKLVAYAKGKPFNAKTICIYHADDESTTIVRLSGSADLGGIVGLEKKGTDKVEARIHDGGSGPFYTVYTVDVTAGRVTRVTND